MLFLHLRLVSFRFDYQNIHHKRFLQRNYDMPSNTVALLTWITTCYEEELLMMSMKNGTKQMKSGKNNYYPTLHTSLTVPYNNAIF